jgi:hypothetical protein
MILPRIWRKAGMRTRRDVRPQSTPCVATQNRVCRTLAPNSSHVAAAQHAHAPGVAVWLPAEGAALIARREPSTLTMPGGAV